MIFQDKIIFGQPITALTVSAPSELRGALSAFRTGPLKAPYVAVLLNDEQVLVRKFSFSNLAIKDLKDVLLGEAIDLLFLPAEDIEMEYYLFGSDVRSIEGIYICAPKALIKSYMFELDKAKVVPIKMTTVLLANIDAFFLRHKNPVGRFCIIDFSCPRIVNLAVFLNKQCQFLRKITYETLEEAIQEVVLSLRSSCTNSIVKEFDRLYVSGESPNREKVLEEIKTAFHTTIEEREHFNINESIHLQDAYFKLNLLKKYVFSFRKRNFLLMITHAVIYVLLMKCIFLGIEIRINNILIQGLKIFHQSEDVGYAKKLEKKLR